MELRRALQKGFLYCLLGTHRINPFWYFKTKGRCFFSRKIKVGFGPITTGEDDLAVRKWRIDPIIDAINRGKSPYCAGFFIHPDEMRKFDLIVIVKRFSPDTFLLIERLKRKGKKFLYDIVDNPNDEERFRFYFRSFPHFLELMDGFILSSPVHRPWMQQKKSLLIEHPILNQLPKTSYTNSSEIRLLAQGYFENLTNLQWLGSFLPQISEQIGKPVKLFFHSEVCLPNSEWVKYIKWDVKNCFEMMRWADIALTMKDLHKPHQYTKPSTKVIAYMAAGLPVLCKPSAADRLVIQHRITGIFAYRQEDWIFWIQALASSLAFRRQIGRAAHKSVIDRFSIEEVVKKYLSLFKQVHV